MTAEDLFAYLPADRLEHHRNALALVPEQNDPDPGRIRRKSPVLPGYLGTDQEFARCYENAGRHRCKELQRLIRPFTLRRTKDAVLHELPKKIEDIRYCRLTDTQVRLYRDAVAARGKKLQQQLARGDADIPYIHIFALLSLLKQICNHPASVDRRSVPKSFKTGRR